MSNEKGSRAMFWGIVLGAIGGAAFTLLRTPRSGKELRGEIASQAGRLTGRGQQSVDQAWQAAGQSASSAWQQAAGVASAVQDQASDAAAAAGDAAGKAVDDLTG